MMLATTGLSDEPIETLIPLKKNAVFVQQSFISFFKVFFRNFVLTSFSL